MTLYLLPNLLGPVSDYQLYLPKSVDQALAQIDGLIAESEGEGRRYLKRFALKKKPHEMPIALLTKQSQELDFLLEPVRKGETWGVVSDCGLPCLADPGASLVMRARELKIPVVAFPGPSSITQALMLSGLSGQSFFFHGYLPKEPADRKTALKEWAKIKRTTHLFIEAPYRNAYAFEECLKTLPDNTLFSVATMLTLPEEWIQTAPISVWKKRSPPELGKNPTIFLFHPN